MDMRYRELMQPMQSGCKGFRQARSDAMRGGAPQQCFVLMRLYGSLIGMIEWGEDIIIDTHELREHRATEGAV